MLSERIRRLRRRRVELADDAIPLAGERRGYPVAEIPQLGQLGGIGGESLRPERRKPVDLALDGQGAGVAQHDVGVGHAGGLQREPGAEGQMIDEYRVGADLIHDSESAQARRDGIPHEVGEPLLRLISERGHHPAAGGLEEAAQ